jgi:uncharacterized protein
MNKVAPVDQLPASAPVPPHERINAIDALRGFALFGVLAINLDTEFRVTFFEQFSFAPLAGLDRVAQTILSLAFEFKAITLFSILFGVGLAIQFDRLAANPRRTILLVRRLLVLLVFGLIHLFLIWNGDILTEYAIAGLLILPILYAPRWASAVAAVLLFLLYLFMVWPFSIPDSAWMAQHVAAARAIYGHGSFAEVAAFRFGEVPQIGIFLAYVFPRTMALMFLGAWVWRTGLLRQLREHARALLGWAAVLISAGLLLTLEQYGFLSVAKDSRMAEDLIQSAAPIVLALGYAAFLLGLSSTPALRPLFAFMAPVGQMAFSNYIGQSIVLSLLFYGFGFGLMGHVSVAGGLSIAVVIYSVQAWMSAWWLKRYRFGPLEWLWRTLMYGERQPWRRSTIGAPLPAAAAPLP